MKMEKRKYMYVDVILTFQSQNAYGHTQEFFEMNLPLNKNETHCVTFLMSKFFPKIQKKCNKFNRDVCDLIKISTASDWNTFKKVTGLESLYGLGHNCKWYFGTNRDDLDDWEIMLMNEYKFGVNSN
jgi:hypothetical protein